MEEIRRPAQELLRRTGMLQIEQGWLGGRDDWRREIRRWREDS
jgi:hypothetical protein